MPSVVSWLCMRRLTVSEQFWRDNSRVVDLCGPGELSQPGHSACFPSQWEAAPRSHTKRRPARCLKSPRAKRACCARWHRRHHREAGRYQRHPPRPLEHLYQHPQSFRKWALPRDVRSTRIFTWTIFEHDTRRVRNSRSEWRMLSNDRRSSGRPVAAGKPSALQPVKILSCNSSELVIYFDYTCHRRLRQSFPQPNSRLLFAGIAELLPAISNVERILIARRNLRDLALFSSVATRKI